MTRCIRLAVLTFAITLPGCARYGWRNYVPPLPFSSPPLASDSSVVAPGELAGRLTVAGDPAHVYRLRVAYRPVGDQEWRPFAVDSAAARFRAAGLSAGRYEVMAAAFGYQPRRDTVAVTSQPRRALILPLVPMPHIAPMMIRVRKPWWKFW